MQIFSASFVLFKIKCICINNALNDGYIILEKNLGEGFGRSKNQQYVKYLYFTKIWVIRITLGITHSEEWEW